MNNFFLSFRCTMADISYKNTALYSQEILNHLCMCKIFSTNWKCFRNLSCPILILLGFNFLVAFRQVKNRSGGCHLSHHYHQVRYGKDLYSHEHTPFHECSKLFEVILHPLYLAVASSFFLLSQSSKCFVLEY